MGRTTSGMTSPAFWRIDPVADPDVLAPDLVQVVESGSRDRRAGDLDRGHVGDRRQGPCPPDVRDDVLDERLDLFRRELEGDGPAGRPADHPQTGLLVEPVDLDDDAVRLVRQAVASLAPALGEGDDALDVEVRLTVGVDREAEPGQSLEGGRLRRDDVGVLDQLIEPGRQLASGGDGRVDLPKRTGAAVARIGVQGEPGLLALLVDAPELGLGHEHLAPCVERGGLGHPGRDDGDGPQVGRHVLAGRAVAAGRALDEPAAVVVEADGQPVDLQFGDVAQLGGRFRGRWQREAPADTCVERSQLVVAEGVRQRQHRARMADLIEGAGRRATDPLCRRLGRGQVREGRFERDELPEQAVVLGVGQLGRVLYVIQLVGPVDRGSELCVSGRGGPRVKGRRGRHQRRIDRGKLDRHGCEGTERAGPAHPRSGGEVLAQVDDQATRMRLEGDADPRQQPCRVLEWRGRAFQPKLAVTVADVGRGAAQRAGWAAIEGLLDQVEHVGIGEHGAILRMRVKGLRRDRGLAPRFTPYPRRADPRRWRVGIGAVAIRGRPGQPSAEAVAATWAGVMSPGVGVPRRDSAISNSSRRIATARSTPAGPPVASAQ